MQFTIQSPFCLCASHWRSSKESRIDSNTLQLPKSYNRCLRDGSEVIVLQNQSPHSLLKKLLLNMRARYLQVAITFLLIPVPWFTEYVKPVHMLSKTISLCFATLQTERQYRMLTSVAVYWRSHPNKHKWLSCAQPVSFLFPTFEKSKKKKDDKVS